MQFFRGLTCIWIAAALLLSEPQCSNARNHFHKSKTSHKNHDKGHVPPVAQPPPPIYNGGDNSTSEPCIFNVKSFGAVGDGNTDDTEAFRSAWKAACSEESSVLLVPSDGVFTITSTIFSGPCKPGFVFQVSLAIWPPSTNLILKDLCIENSPQFHVKFDGCDGVRIEGISISSPALSPNTCTNITMADVELLPYEGVLVDDPFCWNAYGVQETLTIPPISCLQDGMPQSIQERYMVGC